MIKIFAIIMSFYLALFILRFKEGVSNMQLLYVPLYTFDNDLLYV